MITLRAATSADLPFLTRGPDSPSEEFIAKQIREQSLQIIKADSVPVGLIKSCVLWGTLPFMEVILLEPEQRGLGYGTQAVRLWEQDLAARGFDLAVISTQEATAHQFWRKVGYSDCGTLSFAGRPEEIFMQRALLRLPA